MNLRTVEAVAPTAACPWLVAYRLHRRAQYYRRQWSAAIRCASRHQEESERPEVMLAEFVHGDGSRVEPLEAWEWAA